MTVLGIALCFCGFVSLCLAMPRHHEQVLGRKPSGGNSRVLRCAGWALLGLASLPFIADMGPSIGLAAWSAALTIAAALLVPMLSYAPRLPVPLAWGLLSFAAGWAMLPGR